jgi:hypothetical protein
MWFFYLRGGLCLTLLLLFIQRQIMSFYYPFCIYKYNENNQLFPKEVVICSVLHLKCGWHTRSEDVIFLFAGRALSYFVIIIYSTTNHELLWPRKFQAVSEVIGLTKSKFSSADRKMVCYWRISPETWTVLLCYYYLFNDKSWAFMTEEWIAILHFHQS